MVKRNPWDNTHSAPPSVVPKITPSHVDRTGSVQYLRRGGSSGGVGMGNGGGQGGGGGGGGGPTYFTPTTIPTLNASDREVYVDSVGGTDASTYPTRGTIGAPFRTIAYAIPGGGGGGCRDGFGDRLNLKANGSANPYDISGGVLTHINWSGNSATRPFIMRSYGAGSRPVLDSGNSTAIQNDYRTILHDLWFIDLEVTASTYDHVTSIEGMVFTWLMSNVLVEDCYVHKFSGGVRFQGDTDYDDPGTWLLPWNSNPRMTNCRMRGCVIADTDHQSTGTTGQGSFNTNIDTFWWEQCVFINCGWDPADPAHSSQFKHSLYIHAGATSGLPNLGDRGAGGSTDVHVINNICLNTDGFTVRCGGQIAGNVVSRCVGGVQAGVGDTAQVGGVTFNMDDNVVSESRIGATGLASCFAYSLGNVGAGSTFRRNIAGRSMEVQSGGGSPKNVLSLYMRHPDFDVFGAAYTLVVGAPLEISDCIFWHSGYLSVGDGAASYPGTTTWLRNDLQLEDIYASPGNWEAWRWDSGTAAALHMVGTANNAYQSGAHAGDLHWYVRNGSGNTLISTWASDLGDASFTTVNHASGFYPDPERTVSTYATSIGYGSLAAYETALRARRMSTGVVNNLTANALAAYIRAGFGR